MVQLREPDWAPAPPEVHRYKRDSLEFSRIVTLADGIFAIALTLLVLTLDGLSAGPLITFGLAFFLVASVWWQHHRIVAGLAVMEPGLIALNLALLAGVALVPFPTSLVAEDPRSRAAVLAFLIVFTALSLLCLAIILRAHVVGAWLRPLPRDRFRWTVIDWGANLALHLTCVVIAIWAPLAALIGVAFGSTAIAVVVARLGPPDRAAWL